MPFEYEDPIIHMVRKGTWDDPYREIREAFIVDKNGKVVLTEKPNKFRGVKVKDDKGNYLYETTNALPNISEFHVDYIHKVVTFNKVHVGKQFEFHYFGEGNTFIPASSIYTERDGLTIKETLQQLTDRLANIDVSKFDLRLRDIEIYIKDTYRQAVEAATGGKNTVMYDDKGNPSIMVCIPRFNLSDVIDGAPDVPHPAFIVDGVVKNEIWISKYQNIVHDNRAYSLPGMDPRVGVTFNQAKQYCENKGSGWHLMTNAEWAAIALWCKKNGTMPRGNNDYGRDHSAPHERGREVYKDSGGRTVRVATGSGPTSWSHDGTNAGIFDLNGNVTEWVDGIRIEDGKIFIHKDNDFSTPTNNLEQWVDTGAYFDYIGELVLNSKRTAKSGTPARKFEEIKAADGYTIPDLLKYLAIAPIDSDHGEDNVYVNLEGSRFVRRGGSWDYSASAGVFCLNAGVTQWDAGSHIGFRVAWVSPN